MEEWKECKLGDITSLITKGTTPSMIGANFTTNGIKYIKSECILENSRLLDSSKYTFISTETNERLKRSQIIENDILFSMAGMFLGKTGIATKDDVPANTNQAVAIIRITPEKADFKYVYYFLNQKALITYINGISGQSAQPNINLQQISELNIKLPPLPTQQKIAAILSSLDDKIELNNKINTNLEQQAQALFKNWFVDFEPFGGKMPEGWKVGKLSDIAEIKTDTFKPEQNPDIQVEHYSLPAFDEKRYPTFEISKELKSNKFIISNDEVLVSKLNPTVKRVWRPYCLTEKSICSTEFIVYKPISAELKDYLFSIVNSSEFNDFMCSNVTGSTNSHQRTPPKTTLNYEIPIPTKDILHKFCNIVTPMYDKIQENIIQNETVSSLRDTLLPKLMNGEIEVGI